MVHLNIRLTLYMYYCYRKHPAHRKEYRHTGPPASSKVLLKISPVKRLMFQTYVFAVYNLRSIILKLKYYNDVATQDNYYNTYDSIRVIISMNKISLSYRVAPTMLYM